MSEVENALPQGSEQVYESLFGSEINTTTVLFATPHPFSAGSGGHDLYQVSVLKNGQWVMEPVQVRWEDANKQLVVGLHAGGPVSGIRLYHIGGSTGLRKPTSINANPPAGLPHAMEVPFVQPAAWQDIWIQNEGFENFGGYAGAEGWFYTNATGAFDFVGSASNVGSNQTHSAFMEPGTLWQPVNEKLDITAKYQLSVEMKGYHGNYGNTKTNLQLWAGNTKIGELTIPTTDGDGKWHKEELSVNGSQYSALANESLKVQITDEGIGRSAGLYIDNIHLQKLSTAMALFSSPDSVNNVQSEHAPDNSILPIVTSNIF